MTLNVLTEIKLKSQTQTQSVREYSTKIEGLQDRMR